MQKESSSGCANSSAEEQKQQAEAATTVFPPRKDVQKRHDWMVMYKALVAFGDKNGHCNVPLRHPRVMVNETDSAHLGAWLATQRREHLNSKMKPERLALMQKLVDNNLLVWAPLNHSKQSEQTWPLMYECLKMYCHERQIENPGIEVSSIPETHKWKHPDGWEVGLGRWMHTQNKQRRGGKLRADRCAKMEELVSAGLFRWPAQRVLKTNIASDSGKVGASSSSSCSGSRRGSRGAPNSSTRGKSDEDSGKAGVMAPPVQDRSNNMYSLRAAPPKTASRLEIDEANYKPSKRSRLAGELRGSSHSSFRADNAILGKGLDGFGANNPVALGSSNLLGSLYSESFPAAAMQYARQLSSWYILEAMQQKNDSTCDIFFPMPSLQRSKEASLNMNPLMQFTSNDASTLELNPDDIIPLPFKMEANNFAFTDDLKDQIQAQVLASLALDAHECSDKDETERIIDSLVEATMEINSRKQ
jgi:hypothetical protein